MKAAAPGGFGQSRNARKGSRRPLAAGGRAAGGAHRVIEKPGVARPFAGPYVGAAVEPTAVPKPESDIDRPAPARARGFGRSRPIFATRQPRATAKGSPKGKALGDRAGKGRFALRQTRRPTAQFAPVARLTGGRPAPRPLFGQAEGRKPQAMFLTVRNFPFPPLRVLRMS